MKFPVHDPSFTPTLRALSDSLTHTLCTLPRGEMLPLLAVHDLWRLLHDFLALGQDELDVAWVRPNIHQHHHTTHQDCVNAAYM